jgi:GNAT superfamily N-acetyltransferase
MPGELLIRPVTEDDRAQWTPLWDGYNAFYEREGPTALPAEITGATWARFLDDSEPVHALVAERDGQLVGLVHFIFHRNTISIPLVCYLQDLYTDESARGAGVGRALIEAVDSAARDAGVEKVYWHTHETNTTARALYDTLADDSGFVVYRQTV